MLVKEQIRAGRALVGMSAQDLAKEAGVGLSTVQRMENRGPSASSVANLDAVQRALEAAGVEFIAENGGGAGVRLKK